MNLKSILPLAALALSSALVFGQEPEDKNRNAIFVSPLTMIINSAKLEFPVISLAYERSLSETGYSLFVPLHAGYAEDNSDKNVVIGAGLGIRKYFGNAFKGSYITGQTDYLYSYMRDDDDYNYTIDAFGNPVYSPYVNVDEDYLSTSQLSFGYKWSGRQATLDLNIGGAFYAERAEKYTNFIASANIGFPFTSESFGF